MVNAKSILIEQIEQVAIPVLQDHHAELVDVMFVHEHGQWVLRFYLDKPGGITLDDCATISDHLGRNLDAADIIRQSYTLEVSSPGINRPLKKEADYQRFLGQKVDVRLYAPLNGRRHISGTIEAVNGGSVVIAEPQSQQSFTVPIADVAKAQLDPDIQI